MNLIKLIYNYAYQFSTIKHFRHHNVIDQNFIIQSPANMISCFWISTLGSLSHILYLLACRQSLATHYFLRIIDFYFLKQIWITFVLVQNWIDLDELTRLLSRYLIVKDFGVFICCSCFIYLIDAMCGKILVDLVRALLRILNVRMK